MIKKIKNLANTDDKKRLFSNFFSLSLLQAANYIFPLLTLPYLVRVLGVENFGLLAFATALITYFSIITDYGFNLTATREISIHRENKQKVIEIFSSVMTIKVLLMFLSFFLLTILVFSFEKFSKDWEIYFLTFATILGQILFPVWLFQGMERMKYITYLNVLSRLIFTVAIFIFVQEQNDYYMVPLLTSLGSFVAGIWSLVLVKREFRISFQYQTIKNLKLYFYNAHEVFGSSILSTSISSLGIFMLGIFSTNYAVGIYAAIEKLFKAVLSISNVSTQVLYPHVSKLLKSSKQNGIKFLKKIFIFEFIFFIVITICLSVFGQELLVLLYGELFYGYNNLLILSFVWILICILNKYIGNLFMFGLGYFNLYFKALSIASMVSVLFYILLIPIFSLLGVIYAMIIGEALLFFLMLYQIKNRLL